MGFLPQKRERSGSVVECLTQDQGDTNILENYVIGQSQSDPKKVSDKSSSKDASIYQIWDSCLK